MNSSMAASFCASLPKILAMMHSISPRKPWSSSHEHQATMASQPVISAASRADPPLHQLARDDRGAVGPAELGPGDHVGHHHPHGAGGRCAERHPAEVQAVIGDRQAVALRRAEQVLARDAEVVELQPVVVQVPQREQAVADDLEVLVLVVGQVDDQHGGLACRSGRPGRWSGRGRRW